MLLKILRKFEIFTINEQKRSSLHFNGGDSIGIEYFHSYKDFRLISLLNDSTKTFEQFDKILK